MPPIVAARSVPQALRQRLEQALWTMQDSPQGAALLAELHFDRFVPGDQGLYAEESAGGGSDAFATCGD